MTEAQDRIDACLIGELTAPVDPAIHALVAHILDGRRPLAVLFYGSGLRQFDAEGLFDFYIVLRSLSDWPASTLARVANHVLPPNVFYAEHDIGGRRLRAKIAVITLSQFRAGASPRSQDTSLWARFCQPVRLVWVRDAEAADSILELVRQCVVTASGWAARLGEGSLPAAEWWQNLFARTYKAELRVERAGRGTTIMHGQETRYAALLQPAWALGGLESIETTGSVLTPRLGQGQRLRARERWDRMARRGRWRNIARLIKAAFTFKDGAAYLAWKIERHNGFRLALTPFEARHPLICLPVLLWRARRVFIGGMRG
ncbi:hypothetical protein [Asaia krungthepensis]|uniref:Phosphatidate cytidylyltransferase n=1 Tax=Asaia krungthepensis NRIC 0535 TaxID=1307925 RepID=A0ABQ0PY21_9PROT|nr:hypothetical protein [Asaia krungthepensis]GBQ84452.1 hypothetical protein AA0535_0500 [Asaia krungthepensis NRIC 0535]